MRSLALSLIAVSSLSGCGSMAMQSERGARPSYYRPLATTPGEVEAYLKRNVGAKKLKKWNGHVSDDTLVIDIVTNGETNSVGVAK